MRALLDGIYLRLALRKEEGQGMLEYGLIITLVAIVVIGALLVLGPKVSEIYNSASSSL